MLTKEISQTIHLMNEGCAPDQAMEMVESLLDERTRQHNIQMLRNWEANHGFDSAPFDCKIKEMKTQKINIRSLIAEAKEKGFDIEVKACIEVKMVAKPFRHNVKLNISQN